MLKVEQESMNESATANEKYKAGIGMIKLDNTII